MKKAKKETKIIKVIGRVLLALIISFSVIFSALSCLYFFVKPYGIYVAGVSVNRGNQTDILGDGTVYYDDGNNILVFDNATIESDDPIVYSQIDLNIQLIGENKFVCTDEVYGMGVYAGDYNIAKNLAIVGEGTLIIELPNRSSESVGIFASELTIASDVSITVADCENMANGIVCSSSLLIVNKATVTVNNGVAAYSSAVRVRGNALFEEGTSLNVSVSSGTTGICQGFNVSGDLFLGKDTVLNVSIDDASTDQGNCIRVSGLMDIGIGSTVTASAKNASAIECFGSIEANKGATVFANSDQNDADIFCSGAVVNRGAEFNGDVDAIGEIHNRD